VEGACAAMRATPSTHAAQRQRAVCAHLEPVHRCEGEVMKLRLGGFSSLRKWPQLASFEKLTPERPLPEFLNKRSQVSFLDSKKSSRSIVSRKKALYVIVESRTFMELYGYQPSLFASAQKADVR
jgi:hypothetical protein